MRLPRRVLSAAGVVPVAAVLLALAGCMDSTGTGARSAGLAIVPDFGDLAVFADNADRLRIVLTRLSDTTVVADTTVAIDPVTGQAEATLQVQLPGGPELFEVLLQAIRSADGVVLFQGTQSLTITAGGGTTPVNVPVSYAGPTGTSLTVSPRDTAIGPGASFTFGATVRDASGGVVAVPVTFGLVTPADSLILRVQKYTGLATAGTGPTGTVRVVARSADGLTDTARVGVGAVPAGIRIQPGFAVLGTGATAPLAADLVDGAGAVIGPVSTVTWTARSPSVASVSPAGVVSGVAAGLAVIVGTSGTFSDSILVRVPSVEIEVPFAAIGNGRSFARPRAGDTVTVVVSADMRFAGSELLGSYNAQLNWNTAALRYVDVLPGDFGTRTLNDTQASQGTLRFSAADAGGASGGITLARIRFVAQGSGAASLALSVTEVSAAVTFTNLLAFRTVTVGAVTVRP